MTQNKKKTLTAKQELFCKLYATNRDYFGNGVQAYAEAYGTDLKTKGGHATARSNAYRLLTKADILQEVKKQLELGPLNDINVDKELGFLIEQNADFSAKLGAIREYNRLTIRLEKAQQKALNDEDITTDVLTIKLPTG